MKLYFQRPWRQFKAGDPVPEAFAPGVVSTMKTSGIVGEKGPEAKEITATPKDKMVRAGRGRTKVAS